MKNDKIKLAILLVFVAYAMAPDIRLKKVQNDIYMVRGVDALPSEGWVVVDALSTPELSKKYAIITYYHPDHWCGAKTYKDLGAKVIAHKKLMEFYESGEARSGELFKNVVLVPPDIVVEDRLTLKVGEKNFIPFVGDRGASSKGLLQALERIEEALKNNPYTGYVMLFIIQTSLG